MFQEVKSIESQTFINMRLSNKLLSLALYYTKKINSMQGLCTAISLKDQPILLTIDCKPKGLVATESQALVPRVNFHLFLHQYKCERT
jgi:hypothetical protein